MRTASLAACLSVAALATAGCGGLGGNEHADPRVVPVPSPTTKAQGGDVRAGGNLFRSNCAGCHGLDADGSQIAPSLRRSPISDSPTAVENRISMGAGAMPAFDVLLTRDEIRDLVAYVLSVREAELVQTGRMASTGKASGGGKSGGTGQPETTGSVEQADVARGQAVFAANCAACHGARGEGRIGTPLTSNLTYDDVYRQVAGGGGGMPSFDEMLSTSAIENVSAYVVKRLERSP